MSEAETKPKSPEVIFWHRELPPLRAEVLGEHVIEATSSRVPGTLSHRDELWDLCFDELMVQARNAAEGGSGPARGPLCARASGSGGCQA